MSEPVATFQGSTVSVGDESWNVSWPVRQVAYHGGRVLVLYDPMARDPNEHFPNIEAFTPSGAKLWVAEHPVRDAADSYLSLSVGTDLSRFSARSFAGYLCRLDAETGRLVEAEFTK